MNKGSWIRLDQVTLPLTSCVNLDEFNYLCLSYSSAKWELQWLFLHRAVLRIFYCWRFHTLKIILIYYSKGAPPGSAGSLLRASHGWNQGVSSAVFLSGGHGRGIYFQALSSCWQNLVPCGSRTEVAISFLTVGQKSFSASRGHLHSLCHCPLPLFSKHQHVKSLYFESAVWPLLMPHFSCLQLEKLSAFKVLCD